MWQGQRMRKKLALYGAAKALGLFRVARLLTRDRLRILAYHGNELRDESRFMPGVFMRTGTFAARLRAIERAGYPVLQLGDAVRRLRERTLPPCAVVITIDDGFHSTAEVALPLLRAAGMPATVYVTSWYTERDLPIFRLAMQYCFWRSLVETVELTRLGCGVEGTAQRSPELMWELINHGERNLDDAGRTALLNATAAALCVDLAPVLASRMFHLMTPQELSVAAQEFDLQLHTHRHRLPFEPMRARAEIEENRRALGRVVPRSLTHFCYPSGFFSPALEETLSAAGIESATTCEPGLNAPDANRFQLKRFLDGENIPLIEFEAELSGFAPLLRTLLRRHRPAVTVTPDEAARGYPAGPGRTILDRKVA